MKKKSNLKLAIIYVVAIVLMVVILMQFFNTPKTESLTYSDIITYFKKEQVKEFSLNLNNNNLTLVLRTDEADKTKKITYQLADISLFYNDLNEEIKEQITDGTITKADYIPARQTPWWMAYLPTIILIIAFIGFWFYIVNQLGGGKDGPGRMNAFGKARVKTPAPDGKNRITFDDVAGADEEKEELEEIVEFLKAPQKFTKLGAKIPHGVLLVGPPGTGKTLLAKAVAGEAGVPFFSISGSDFVEMYVGVGASRVRDLFETARKAPASIIFIDEIDAVGRHRGAGLGGGHDEREQTLNQLLVEMDGFGSHDGIIVMAATNRPDILDPALLRPGRFDRTITVNYPDIRGREAILEVHARKKQIGSDVSFAEIAKTTAGFTGADLANLLNEAALLAARRGKSCINMDDIEDAFIRVVAGPKKKSRKMQEREIKNTAYHEAGHAILAHELPTMDPVQQISIIPSGNALGYTLNPPAEDKFSVYKQELKEKIAMLLAGRAAEEIIFGDVSGGASNDIERATETAKKMVTQLGMSDLLGPVRLGTGQSEIFLGRDFSADRDYSEEVAAKIDSEVHKLVADGYATAKRVLNENIDKLHFIAGFLIKNEVMDGEQFKRAMEEEVTYEELEEMTEAKRRRNREESDERARAAAQRKQRQDDAKAAEDAAHNRGYAPDSSDYSGNSGGNSDGNSGENSGENR